MAKNTNLLVYYLSRPICVVLLAMIILAVFAPALMNALTRRMNKPDAADTGADADSDD